MLSSAFARVAFVSASIAGAILVAPAPAHARIGDVVALVDASTVSAAPVTGPVGAVGPAGGMPARAALRAASAPLASALADHGIDRIEALGAPFVPATGGAEQRLVLLGSSGTPWSQGRAQDLARDLSMRGVVVHAMADRALKLFDTVPNDTFLFAQYWLLPTGGGVHVEDAWDITQGSTSVVIGVIDTGVDTGHPDLAAKIWTNPGEVPGNGIDDDGNGYVDDVHGWDFGDNDNDPNPTPAFDELGLDEGFHGTAVAGVAAASTNNQEGIAGVGWQSKILPLKFTDTAGQSLASYAGEAMLYAAAKHVQVLNMSWGAAGPDSATRAFFQGLVNQENAANVLCVAAAGNDNTSVEAVPAACTGTLSVGSTSETNTRSSFSNFGPWVNIAAPGEGIWAPISRNYQRDDVTDFWFQFFYGYDGVHPYMSTDGTSLSTPIVSGACSLVRAKYPTAAPFGVIQQVIQTGDNIIFDQHIGPKLNVRNALVTPLGVADLPRGGAASGLSLAAARPTPFVDRTSLAFELARAMDASLTVYDAAGRPVRTLAAGAQSAGLHVVAWDGADGAGRRAPAGLYFAVLRGAGAQAVTRLVRIE